MQTSRLLMELSLPTAFLFFSPLTICLSSCTLITSLWHCTVLSAFMTWSRLSVEPTEFAIALKWSFHRFAILLFPEIPPSVSGKDSFLGLSALISFQKSLHSPLCSFDSIDWERSWSSFSLKKFHFMPEGSSCPTFCSASGPLLGRLAIFKWLDVDLCIWNTCSCFDLYLTDTNNNENTVYSLLLTMHIIIKCWGSVVQCTLHTGAALYYTPHRCCIVLHVTKVLYCATRHTGAVLCYTPHRCCIVIHATSVLYCATRHTGAVLCYTPHRCCIVLHATLVLYCSTRHTWRALCHTSNKLTLIDAWRYKTCKYDLRLSASRSGASLTRAALMERLLCLPWLEGRSVF